MAKPRIITCQDCGADYMTARPNTKRCQKCGLLQSLEYLGTRRTYTCDLCSKKFAPLERGDTTCSRCIYQPKKHGEAECVYCHETALQVRADVPICHSCARNPELRPRVIKSLRLGRDRRRATVPA